MIFGIGLPKTGNVSFAEYLRLNGLTGVVNPGKNIKEWKKVKDKNNEYQFVVDTPCNLTYQILDKKYKYSKFVYTYRNNEDWKQSWENHKQQIEPVSNFAKRLRAQLEKYESVDQHYEEVLKYFGENCDRLFVLDLDNLDVHDLAAFLNLKPMLNYPHKNKTEK